ncbi:MAG: hypothetical protein GXP40_01350 [Chloroflexi bacterium]|nr:hypothetical protein [Chloroflexota bacterium]
MAVIRCPVCGKPNPDDLELCQHCDSSLKPTTAELDGVSEMIRPGEAPTKKVTAELEQTLPAWLRGARKSDQTEDKEETPSDALSPPPQKSVSIEEPAAEEDLPNWLDGLEAEAESDEEEVPDWLANLQTETPVSAEETAEPEDEPDEGRPAVDEPITATSEPVAPRTGELIATPEGELPGWLADLQAESGEAAETPGEDLPDLIVESEQQAAELPADSEPAAAETAGTEKGLPDWLAKLSAEEGPGAPPAEEPSRPAPASTPGEELPDWLSAETPAAAPPQEHEPEPAAAQPAQEELPDWISRLPADETPAGAKTEQPAEAEAAPDWLSGQGESEAAQPSAPVESAAESASPADNAAPDWLSRMSDVSPEMPAQDAPEQPAAASDDGVPDWLSSLPAVEQNIEQQPAKESTPALILDEETISEDDMDAIFSMEMPDWLSTLSPEEKEATAGEGETPAPEESPASLESAELPSWVQAMRPVESVVPESPGNEDIEHVIAREGPLAGLNGILPVGPGIGPFNKAQAHSIKLQVSESQQSSAALLEKMLSTESEPRPLSTPPQVLPARVLRWVIALLMFLAVGASTFAGTRMTPLASLYPPEVGAVKDVINSLPDNAPVLLVFDYEPGFAGELEAAAAPVVDHLMLRGERLTILSTSPTGAALAERFLRNTQADHGYQSGQQYVNLGYLPGGSSGVLSFAMLPPAATHETIDGLPAWDTPPLQGVSSLADFAALVVLTDSMESGRTWIEQTSGYLDDTPLLMVVSAQAEPVIHPYYESGQVDGMVSGLSGGAAYEQINGRPGLGRQYWDAYSIGLFMAEILIAVGGVLNLVAAWRARQTQQTDED